MDKTQWISTVESLLRANDGVRLEDASVPSVYRAVSRATMADILDTWESCKRGSKKRVGYLSAEFLVGRAVYSNLYNLGRLETVREWMAERGVDISVFEEIEDASLGNGGLGRLAACYLESGATVGLPLDGYGIRYRYGLFKQEFVNGFQKEEADDWQRCGDPWSYRREDESVLVEFADYAVRAVPYDMPVIGYGGKTVNTLRLWQSEEAEGFDFAAFDNMQTDKIAKNRIRAESISYALYPNDSTERGRLLRLRQEYFFTSASIQDIVRKHKAKGLSIDTLNEYVTLQLNDTHPVFAVPELIRLAMRDGLDFEAAFLLARSVFNFTNHTILGEALECWDMKRVRKLLPAISDILRLMQRRIAREFPDGSLYLIRNNTVHMANVAIYAGSHVNGVAALHTEILKASTFRDWYAVYPERFINVTNGVTPRRWLALCNPELSAFITEKIGDGWQTDLERLRDLSKYACDPTARSEFAKIKYIRKSLLSEHILKKEGVLLPPEFIFDVQAKRLHEYKRQLLNAFSILYYYFRIKEGKEPSFKPTAFIFGAKAAPAYYLAKAIIKFIQSIADKVNNDPEVNDKLRVVFVTDYNVSYAEKIMTAADISEQISMAGMEASGTGNMKFMLNGTVTLGTMDGANVEISEEAGIENEYIFGATVDEVGRVKENYDPHAIYESDPELRRIVDTLDDGTFDDMGTGMFKELKNSLFGGWSKDHYLVLHDFRDYVRVKSQLNRDYGSDEFLTKCILNTASAGKFSSDRSVLEYAKHIWKV
ncbi:MAG: glycogen/starch/alpha-glucan family phosphorylase [Clostridia bacterium]|nr:glycogen/starch/alpha-glucan family phosphorylase [Clostridia bacterium]